MYSSSSFVNGSGMRRGQTFEPGFDDAIESGPRMAAVRQPHVLRHSLPVVNLLARVGVGGIFVGAARNGLAVEVLELRRELPDDPRFPFGREIGQLQTPANECGPVTHRRCP